MGLEEARQQIEQQFSSTEAPQTQDTPIEASGGAPEVADSQEQPQTAQEVADLAKLQKVLLDGEELSYEELKKERMRLKDYTRKTQELAEERRRLQEESKYDVNLGKDLEVLWEQPWRAEEFRKLYPEQYHHHAERIERMYRANPAQWSTSSAHAEQGQQQTQAQQPQDIERLVEKMVSQRLKPIEEREAMQEEQRYLAQMDAMETKMLAKYKWANRAEVYALAEYMSDQGQQLDQAKWEAIFKDSHERTLQAFKKAQSEQFDQQKATNQKLKDVAAGGGVPGEAPVAPKSMKEATAFALKQFGG